MPSLAEMQQEFARAIWSDDAPAFVFAPGPVSVEAALRVHRNTVLGALTGALRLVYPGVERLVGEAFFDQAAAQFARAVPPTNVCLADYGEGFPEFLERYEPAAGLPYLADVARLELAIDRAGQEGDARMSYPLESDVRIELPQAIYLLSLNWPADAIKHALDAGDDAALAEINLQPGSRWLVVWLKDGGAAVKPVGPAAGQFLRALLDGVPAAQAFEFLSQAMSPQDAAREVQQDIFASSFCRVITQEP